MSDRDSVEYDNGQHFAKKKVKLHYTTNRHLIQVKS